MSEAPDQAEPVAPAPEPEIPVAEPPAAEPAPEPAEGDPAPEGEGQPAPEEPKKPKSPIAQLQGRIGHLTKVAHEKDATLDKQARQLEAYKALLESQGKAPPVEGEPEPRAVTAPTTAQPADFNEAVRAEARRIAAEERFTSDCNSIFEAGEKAHGDGFKESVSNLNMMGIMSPQLVEAALVTDAPSEVIHFLGSDLDEAARITSLSPIRMAAELTKLATTLNAKPPGAEFSRAPAPIRPVGGTAKPEVDLANIATSKSMSEYVAARKAQGSRWAR